MADKPSKKRILVIEDESALLFALKAQLSHAGYEIDAALSGEEGINKAHASKPDTIILDLMLPEMSGFEVLEKLKTDTKTKDIPVLIASNLADTDSIEHGKELGAVDYIVKTQYSLEKITERIEDVLKKTL